MLYYQSLAFSAALLLQLFSTAIGQCTVQPEDGSYVIICNYNATVYAQRVHSAKYSQLTRRV